jgi:hypothetical protein
LILTWLDAYNALQAEILNTLEDYEESALELGPEALRQLVILKNYIERETK